MEIKSFAAVAPMYGLSQLRVSYFSAEALQHFEGVFLGCYLKAPEEAVGHILVRNEQMGYDCHVVSIKAIKPKFLDFHQLDQPQDFIGGKKPLDILMGLMGIIDYQVSINKLGPGEITIEGIKMAGHNDLSIQELSFTITEEWAMSLTNSAGYPITFPSHQFTLMLAQMGFNIFNLVIK